jgi:hypothetical protein
VCNTAHGAHSGGLRSPTRIYEQHVVVSSYRLYTSAEDVDGLVSTQCRRMYLAARPGRRRRFTGPGGHCRASPGKRCTLSSHQAGVMRARNGWENCGSGRTTHFSVTLAAETRSTNKRLQGYHEPLWVEGKSFATCTGCFGFTQCHSHTIGRHRGRHPTYFCPACRRFCFAMPGFAQAVIGRSPRRTERTVRNHELRLSTRRSCIQWSHPGRRRPTTVFECRCPPDEGNVTRQCRRAGADVGRHRRVICYDGHGPHRRRPTLQGDTHIPSEVGRPLCRVRTSCPATPGQVVRIHATVPSRNETNHILSTGVYGTNNDTMLAGPCRRA